jgi:murein DD-endopeptidase MepM/ murein hydrolase activator NlpD
MRSLLLATATALAFGTAPVLAASQNGASAVVTSSGASVIKDEHVKPSHAVRNPTQLFAQEPTLRTTTSRAPGTAAPLTAQASSLGFLTRPYTTWHTITSVFDHCNPDYSLDYRVCRFDGTVGLSSNGVDPSFSKGYAITPGGGDYLYYDGHNGWDYALSYENVLAAADGTVRLAGIDSVNPCFGQTIIIDHPNGYSTRYAHLSSIYVSQGQSVTRAQVIAQSGNTGCSSGPHLHFGVYITSSWTAIDPWGWEGAGSDPWPSDVGNLWLTGTAQFPLPWPPTNVFAQAGNGSATVTWTAPSFTGGTPIANYTVTSSPGNIAVTVAGTANTATVTGLTNGTQYSFTVLAVSSTGSTISAPSNGVIPAQVPISGPEVSSWGAGRLDVFAKGTDGGLWVKTYDQAGGGWTTWASLGGQIASDPAAVSWAPGRIDVFALGSDKALWHIYYDGRSWSKWISHGGTLASGPAVTTWGPGRLDVFARGANNDLQHIFYAYTAGGWSNWVSHGGQLAGDPGAASWAPGRIDVFAQGSDNTLKHLIYDPAVSWSGWFSHGGSLSSGPSVATWGIGRLDVFALGTASDLQHIAYDSGDGGWSSWSSLGGQLAADPAAISWGSHRIDVFAKGADNGLWHMYFWGSWSYWIPN